MKVWVWVWVWWWWGGDAGTGFIHGSARTVATSRAWKASTSRCCRPMRANNYIMSPATSPPTLLPPTCTPRLHQSRLPASPP